MAKPELSPPAVGDTDRVPWVRPFFEADDALLADIRRALVAGQVTNNGEFLRTLEAELARYLGVEDCVVVASGSAALLLAMRVLGLAGTRAVVPAFTFIATLNALVHSGVTPVFCDIDPETWTLSPTQAGRLLATDRAIRMVVPVNVFGVPPDLLARRRLVGGTQTALLLDNAHGLGTEAAGRRCPPEPLIQTYSLHATKTLPAIEGGAVVASDPRLLAEVRRLRNHGLAADLLESTAGFNAKMSELHAVVALRSLRTMDAVLARRRAYAARLRQVLEKYGRGLFGMQRIPDGVQSNFQNLAVVCSREDRGGLSAIQAEFAGAGVETRRYFWPPLHDLPAYRGRFTLPVTEAVARNVLCLPLHSLMEPAVLERIEAAIRRVAARFA